METVVIYTSKTSNRLRYVADWLFIERLKTNYIIATNILDIEQQKSFISYGEVFEKSISIPCNGLLFQTGIKEVNNNIGTWNLLPVIFGKSDNGYSLSFDFFSAIFYLLSRYEEYYNFTPDKHNRYPPTESILYKNNWLLRPLVDEWVFAFRKLLIEKHNFNLPYLKYSFQPSYDIDIAYSFLNKGLLRNSGTFFKNTLKGNFSYLIKQINILSGKSLDPYDSFDFLQVLHQSSNVKPKFFILSALKTTDFDKNILPTNNAMVKLIKELSGFGDIGIHPSYFSDKGNLLLEEKLVLEKIIDHNIKISRQHYIKLNIPSTFHNLESVGITDDYSMGYGSKLGFRAGTSNSFLWYNFKEEKAGSLRIHPFCFMDTTCLYEEKIDLLSSFKTLNTMNDKLKNIGGTMVTIFHNFSLGTDSIWAGWNEQYMEFFIKNSTL